MSQLQLCQNNAIQIFSLWHKFHHSTPILKDLHWLPLEQRIRYDCRLAEADLRMPLHQFGILSLLLLNMPLPFPPSGGIARGLKVI